MLGVDTSAPVANAPVLDDALPRVLDLAVRGRQVVSGGKLAVEGVAQLLRGQRRRPRPALRGHRDRGQEPFTAEAWMGDKLYPFSGSIDLSGVPAGKYIVMAMTDDPSGGAEGNGAFSDTRITTVQ